MTRRPGPVPATRRSVLAGTAALALGEAARADADADTNADTGPAGEVSVPCLFFTAAECAAVDAIVARLIPNDALGPGAREAGGTVFIDRQLAGPYGEHDGLYMAGPFAHDPLPSQGLQSPLTPRQRYRDGLRALDAHCRARHAGRGFAELTPDQQHTLLAGLETGAVALPGVDGRALFRLIHANTIEGFFADPIYGGNKDMVGWKLLGFPGARYDHRDVIDTPNQPDPRPPLGLRGRPGWERDQTP